jgi:quinol monooxygenase YgiN
MEGVVHYDFNRPHGKQGRQVMILLFFRAIVLADGKALPNVRAHKGLISAYVGLPHLSSPNEFSMVMLWRDLDALKEFTGDQWQNAVINPAETHLLAETHVYPIRSG